MVILTLRMVLSTIAATWRLIFFRATGPSSLGRMSDHVALPVYAALTFEVLPKTRPADAGISRG
jgi:hypothetical protein